ncbi:MAG: hypothetical protein ACK47B_21570 [Armatimonadota bacterium]
MTWFDGLLLLGVAATVAYQMRQEAGRTMLDTVAAVAAAHFSRVIAPTVTVWLGWKALPGWDSSPVLQALCFALLLAGLLLASRVLHRQTRWTMDQFDPVFGLVFALVTAAVVGHSVADLWAGIAVARTGQVPDYLASSLLGEELRSFHSFHAAVNAIRRDF